MNDGKRACACSSNCACRSVCGCTFPRRSVPGVRVVRGVRGVRGVRRGGSSGVEYRTIP